MSYIKQFLFWITLFAVVGIGVLLVLSRVYGEEIKRNAISEVNKILKAKIDLKEIDVSLVQTFPYAGIILSEVYVYDPIVPGKQLLENATVSLKFSLIPIISGNYKLQKIDIVAEKAMVKKYPDGWNYVIWHKSEKKSGNFSLDKISFDLKELEVDEGKVFISSSDVKAELILKNDDFLDANYSFKRSEVSVKSKKYQLSASKGEVKGLYFQEDLIKNISLYNELAVINFARDADLLKFSGELKRIREIQSLIGQDFGLTGSSKFTCSYNLSKEAIEFVEAIQPQVSIEKADVQTTQGSLKADFRNGLSLNGDISFSWQGNKIHSTISSKNNIAYAKADAQDWNWNISGFNLSGKSYEIELAYSNLNKLFKNFSTNNLKINKASFNEVQAKGELFTKKIIWEGSLSANDKSLNAESTKLLWGTDEGSGNVSWTNFNDLLSGKKLIALDANLEFETLEIDEGKFASDSEGEPESDIEFSFKGDIKAKNLKYHDFDIENATASVVWKDPKLEIDISKAWYLSAPFFADFALNTSNNKWNGNLNIKGLQSSTLFKEFNNWGQEYVTYRHLSGPVNIVATFSEIGFNWETWNNNNISVNFYDGELRQLPLLKDLKAGIKGNLMANLLINQDKLVRRFEEVNIRSVKANASLKKTVLHIHSAELNSPQLSLTTKGKYGVKTENVDMVVSMFLKDIFSQNPDAGTYIVSERQGSKLNLGISGSMDNPKFSLLESEKERKDEKGLRKIFGKKEEIESDKEGPTLFSIDNASEEEPEKQEEKKVEKAKKKIGKFFKKILDAGENIENKDTATYNID